MLLIHHSNTAKKFIQDAGDWDTLHQRKGEMVEMGWRSFRVGVEVYDPSRNLYQLSLYYQGFVDEDGRKRQGYLYLTTLKDIDHPGAAESIRSQVYSQHNGFEATRIHQKVTAYE